MCKTTSGVSGTHLRNRIGVQGERRKSTVAMGEVREQGRPRSLGCISCGNEFGPDPRGSLGCGKQSDWSR